MGASVQWQKVNLEGEVESDFEGNFCVMLRSLKLTHPLSDRELLRRSSKMT